MPCRWKAGRGRRGGGVPHERHCVKSRLRAAKRGAPELTLDTETLLESKLLMVCFVTNISLRDPVTCKNNCLDSLHFLICTTGNSPVEGSTRIAEQRCDVVISVASQRQHYVSGRRAARTVLLHLPGLRSRRLAMGRPLGLRPHDARWMPGSADGSEDGGAQGAYLPSLSGMHGTAVPKLPTMSHFSMALRRMQSVRCVAVAHLQYSAVVLTMYFVAHAASPPTGLLYAGWHCGKAVQADRQGSGRQRADRVPARAAAAGRRRRRLAALLDPLGGRRGRRPYGAASGASCAGATSPSSRHRGLWSDRAGARAM